MARKVFISVLGTGNYQECTYKKGEFELRTRFAQEATLKYLQGIEPWEENSDIYMLLTTGARDKNWEVCKDSNGNVTDERGLLKVLQAMKLNSRIHDVTIKEGKDEGELWDIFSTVFELLQDGDELYFDLTHGFRYLPMLVLVLGNYAKFLKNATVKSITYGNYEMSERGTKPAPIIDLLPLSSLQDWTFAAANFVKNGDIAELEKNSMKEIIPILSNPLTCNEEVKSLRTYINSVKTLITQMRFCRGIDIYKSNAFASMQKYLPKGTIFIQPLNPLLEKIGESTSDFTPTISATNLIVAAKWCFERGQYQAAATLLQEGIVTFFCDRHYIDPSDHKKREIVNHAFNKRYFQMKQSSKSYSPMKEEEDEEKVNIVITDPFIADDDLVLQFRQISDLRNDFNHAGMNANPMKIEGERGLKQKIAYYISCALQKYCNINIKQIQKDDTNKPRLLINLSNHPNQLWPAEQREAAAAYGDCIEDMPFPAVDPQAGEDYIAEQTEKCLRQILEWTKSYTVTVHVMGEMCLTYNIIRKLQAHGIRCIASTTERISEELPDGSKRVEFHFKRFREYGD